MIKYIKIRTDQMGLRFRDGEFEALLTPGRYWVFDPLGKVRVQIVSTREPWLVHEKLDIIAKSGVLKGRAVVLDLQDDQRALVTIDGRQRTLVPPGLYALWTTHRRVAVEVFITRDVRFEHSQLPLVVQATGASNALDVRTVEAGQAGVLFIDGNYVETLPPGRYAFWKNVAQVKLVIVDLRETMLDIAGQDVMTADKVTLRMNTVVTYRVVDPRQATTLVEDVRQALYREAQLALRTAVNGRDLDTFLADKDAVSREMEEAVRGRLTPLGLEIVAVGIRDVILPGDMKDLMNKVTEAKKAAEANLIVRREETAAMRSQANTAKILEGNPTLMRLRELEVLERIAAAGKLNVVMGEKGLAHRVVNLL